MVLRVFACLSICFVLCAESNEERIAALSEGYQALIKNYRNSSSFVLADKKSIEEAGREIDWCLHFVRSNPGYDPSHRSDKLRMLLVYKDWLDVHKAALNGRPIKRVDVGIKIKASLLLDDIQLSIEKGKIEGFVKDRALGYTRLESMNAAMGIRERARDYLSFYSGLKKDMKLVDLGHKKYLLYLSGSEGRVLNYLRSSNGGKPLVSMILAMGDDGDCKVVNFGTFYCPVIEKAVK